MKGVVTDHLVQLIAKQLDDRGLVVWYDPEQAYDGVAAELRLPSTTVARYDDSFLQLRKEIDHLLNDSRPPRLVVYVPIEQEKTHSALIELDCAGVVIQPRQQPPACNTRLSVVARNALKPILGEDQVGEIERQVEAGDGGLGKREFRCRRSVGLLRVVPDDQPLVIDLLGDEMHKMFGDDGHYTAPFHNARQV